MEMETRHVGENFSTRDFWLAAALAASGCRILRLDWHGARAQFVFDDGRCDALADNYWSGTLQVSARAMADALRTLKDRLHNGDDNAAPPSTQRSSANTR